MSLCQISLKLQQLYMTVARSKYRENTGKSYILLYYNPILFLQIVQNVPSTQPNLSALYLGYMSKQ